MTRGMAVVGLVGAIALAAIGVAGQSAWGPPGSAAYTAYELMTRLTGAGLVMMGAAPLALRRAHIGRDVTTARRPLRILVVAIVVMAIGSAAEFIVFTTAPYSGPGSETRNLSWLTFLAAGMVAVIAATLSGVAFLRDPRISRLLAVAMVIAPSIGVLVALANQTFILAVPPLGIVSALGALALAPGPLGGRPVSVPELRAPLIEGFRRPLDGGRRSSSTGGRDGPLRPEESDYSE